VPQFIERGEKVSTSRVVVSSFAAHGTCFWRLGSPCRQGPLLTGPQPNAGSGLNPCARAQVTKYVEREILNHRFLMHPQCVPWLFDMTFGCEYCTAVCACARALQRWLPSRLLQAPLAPARSIVQFKEVFLTPRYLAIAMEFVAGGDMFEYVVRKGGLKESEARWFFQQLIVGVDYLHRMVRCLLWAGSIACGVKGARVAAPW